MRSLPAWAMVVATVGFALIPIGVMLLMSFSSSEFVRIPPPGFSFEWYETYLGRADWIDATLRSIRLGLVVAALAVLAGVPAALAIAGWRPALARAAVAIATLPLILPPIVVAVAMYMTFNHYGIVGSEAGIVAGHLAIALPFVILTTLASLRGLDPELVRAARSLGAGRARVLATITLPLARPGIVSGAVLAFLTSFDELLIALFIGSSTTRTLPRRMWEGIRSEFDPTVAAASAIVVLGTAILALILLRFQGRGASPAPAVPLVERPAKP
jgi:ABC-type spermidine/putrescine transport system permease subunit II